MKSKLILCLSFFTISVINAFGQDKALTFQEAEKRGISIQHLDSIYKSAIHDDVKLAVFKSAAEQEKLKAAYNRLLQDLGSFLKANNFRWENQTRCFNRIYLNADGNIDYFLINFPKDQITTEKEKEFSRLLNLFIRDYKFALTANEKFAQCSPVKYSDN